MCCGNKRNEHAGRSSSPNYSSHPSVHPSRTTSDVYFEYTGETGLTVTGSITGKKYRFSGKGDMQLIDYNDSSGMMGVPVLKRVK